MGLTEPNIFIFKGCGGARAVKWARLKMSVVRQNNFSLVSIIGNLVARKIPVLIVANKMDLKKADIKKIEAAFPEYEVVGISAKFGDNLEEFYESIFKLSKKI